MLRELVRKEIREILFSRKFAVTFGTMAVLILLAFYSGALNYTSALRDYEAAVETNRSQLDEVTAEFRVSWQVFLRPEPLQSVVLGVSNDVGRSTHVIEWADVAPRGSRYEEDTLFAVFRLLDFEFVVTIALSLFAVVFAFDAVSGEKERGTLALLLSNAVPRDTVILGKVLGTFLALGVPLLIPILIGAALLPLLGVELSSDEWIRLGLIVLAASLYVGVFMTLSVFASTLTRRSSLAFLILLVFWIVAVQVVPRIAGGVASRQVSVLPRSAITQEEWRLQRAHFSESSKKVQELQEAGDEEANTKWEDILDDLRMRDAHILEALEERRRNELDYRKKVSLNLSRVSPSAVFRLAASRLAHTGPTLDERFVENAKEYRRAWLAFAEEYEPDWRNTKWEDRAKPIEVGPPPQFHADGPSLAQSVAAALPDLGVLAVLNVLLFGGTVLAFRRYDVR